MKPDRSGGEAWSFARRLKQQEMTSRAPFAATYGMFRPALDVLLIHLLEATMSPFPVNPRWYDEYWMTERRPRQLRLAAALRRLRSASLWSHSRAKGRAPA